MPSALRLQLCAGLSLLLAAACLWGFLDSRQAPPQNLQRAQGTVAWTEGVMRRGRVREMRFALDGQPRVHEYSEGLPGLDRVLAGLRKGSVVTLEHGPGGAHDLWAFQMDGRETLRPEQRLQGLRNAGWLFLGLALACLGLAAWFWRRAQKRSDRV